MLHACGCNHRAQPPLCATNRTDCTQGKNPIARETPLGGALCLTINLYLNTNVNHSLKQILYPSDVMMHSWRDSWSSFYVGEICSEGWVGSTPNPQRWYGASAAATPVCWLEQRQQSFYTGDCGHWMCVIKDSTTLSLPWPSSNPLLCGELAKTASLYAGEVSPGICCPVLYGGWYATLMCTRWIFPGS